MCWQDANQKKEQGTKNSPHTHLHTNTHVPQSTYTRTHPHLRARSFFNHTHGHVEGAGGGDTGTGTGAEEEWGRRRVQGDTARATSWRANFKPIESGTPARTWGATPGPPGRPTQLSNFTSASVPRENRCVGTRPMKLAPRRDFLGGLNFTPGCILWVGKTQPTNGSVCAKRPPSNPSFSRTGPRNFELFHQITGLGVAGGLPEAQAKRPYQVFFPRVFLGGAGVVPGTPPRPHPAQAPVPLGRHPQRPAHLKEGMGCGGARLGGLWSPLGKRGRGCQGAPPNGSQLPTGKTSVTP